MTDYIKISKQSTNKLLELVSESNNVSESKDNIKESYFYILAAHRKLKIPFIIVTLLITVTDHSVSDYVGQKGSGHCPCCWRPLKVASNGHTT